MSAKRILLVEDDEANRLTLEALLECEGHEIDAVESFDDAEARLDAGYDWVLLDFDVKGVTATSFIPTVRARLPESKVVLVSGCADPDALEAADAGFDKGGAIEDLLRLLESL